MYQAGQASGLLTRAQQATMAALSKLWGSVNSKMVIASVSLGAGILFYINRRYVDRRY